MKRVMSALVLVLLCGCSGLPRARELGEVAILRTIGLDADVSGVEMTVVDADRSLSALGSSAASAAREIQGLGERYISFGHVDRLVLGEGLAMKGLDPVIDYLAREPQLGLGVELWVADGRAADILDRQGSSERLSQMQSRTLGCSAATLMSVQAREGSVCIPAVTLTEQDGAERLESDGYALIRKGKLVSRLRADAAAGYELLCGQGVGGVADVSAEGVGVVSLRLERIQVRVKPVFQERELTGLDICCGIGARVGQQEQSADDEQLRQIGQDYERLQAGRMVQALEQAQYWDADFADLQRRAMLACPSQKESISRQFGPQFRSVTIRVTVDAQVERDENEA